MYTIFDVINHRIVLKYTYDFSYDLFDSNVSIFHLRAKMDSEEEVAAAAMIIAICVENDERKKTRKRRKVWVKPLLQKIKSHGFYSQLLNKLRLEDFEMYENYLGMKPENFDEILHFVRYIISKDTTHLREPIAPEIKLAITIRFLATGNTYRDLSSAYRMHNSTIGKIVPEVCDAICEELIKYSNVYISRVLIG